MTVSNEYKHALGRAAHIAPMLKERIESIVKEGRKDHWTRAQKRDAFEKAQAQLREETAFMEREALTEYVTAQKLYEHTRRPPSTSKDKTGELLASQRFERMFSGMSPQEALQAYEEHTFHQDDKKFRWLAEEILESKVRGTDAAYNLDDALSVHRSVEERVALVGVQQAETWKAHDSTLRGLLQQDIEAVAEGRDPVGYDYQNELFEEMDANTKAAYSPGMEKNVAEPAGDGS